MSKVRILSIDGGGIRGIIPGVIVAEIENRIQERVGPAARIGQYFDLMAGTSTGGILTCCYLTPGDDGVTPRFSAQQAVDLYLENGDEIFHRSLGQKIRSGAGLLDEKYSSKQLEKQLAKYFADTQLRDLLSPCVISSYDIERREARFFKSHDALAKPSKNFYVRDAARCTAAAPTYFEAAKVSPVDGGDPYALIDGGVFANNPALCAYAEARTINFTEKGKADCPGANDMFLLSLSTSSVEKRYDHDDAKDWGPVGWIKPLIDIMMGGNSETVHYQLKQIWGTLEGSNCEDYIRIDPPRLKSVNPDMDDASPENMEALVKTGKAYIADNGPQIDGIVDKLLSWGAKGDSSEIA